MKQFVLILLSLLALVTPSQAADEAAYYLIGWLNNWSETDKSYPFTLQADSVTWSVTVPPAGDSGWFKIAPASAYEAEHFWHALLCAPFDGCRELSGTMEFGGGGAWLLPNQSGVESYTLNIVPSTMEFQIIPNGGKPQKAWSGTLPLLYINTEHEVTSRDEYVMGTYYIDALGLEGYSSLGSADSPLPLQVKGRGNYTWTAFKKKPYRLKFDKKAAPLGMNKSKHFTLLAHADDDLGFLRNTVGFALSSMLRLSYTPEQRPVEVIWNGDYIGLYMLTDKIRVDEDRVNITEQQDMETDPDIITGGWLVEIDNYDEEEQIRLTESNGSILRFTLHSPEVLSEAQRDYMTSYLQATDLAIYDPDKTTTLWEDYIDVDTLARFYIVQEIMDNAESFHGSCYIHKERGDDAKLEFGPVWDFGNSFHRGFDKFIYVDSPFGQNWIGEIARYPRFQQAVKSAWLDFLAAEYPKLDGVIDGFITQIASAVRSDDRRWPEYAQGDLDAKKHKFKDRLSQKLDFLLQEWGDHDTGVMTIAQTAVPRDVWYTLDGRRLNGKPQSRGIYLCQGKKVFLYK